MIGGIQGNSADAISIALALTIVSLVAAVQEYRSERALEALSDLVPHTCTVLRDGRAIENLSAKELVVGDLVLLSTGDRVPADMRLIDTVELSGECTRVCGRQENCSNFELLHLNLEVNESSLTGEGCPVNKISQSLTVLGGGVRTGNGSSDVAPTPPPLTDQINIAFMGTLVVSGRGRGLVLAVGERTEFGKVAKELGEVEARRSPLQMKIDELGRTLAYASSAGIAVMGLVGYLLGRGLLETITVAVSLAVAAIPEGLPICVTVTLALGVLRMARHAAIVKKLPAVETLGCATVIASDKTGTLTQNEMTARSVYSPAFPFAFSLTGVGYDVKKSGGFIIRSMSTENMQNSRAESENSVDSEISGLDNIPGQSRVTNQCSEYACLAALFGTASICNNASVAEDGKTLGQPTEMALLVGSQKAGVPDPRPTYHRIQEIPFSSDRKRMEVRCRPVGGSHACLAFALSARREKSGNVISPDGSVYFVKGMPESILAECQTCVAADGSSVMLTDSGKARALSQSRAMSGRGLRVLAMAFGPSLETLSFAGIIGIEDPPRDGVVESIRNLHKSGVKVRKRLFQSALMSY